MGAAGCGVDLPLHTLSVVEDTRRTAERVRGSTGPLATVTVT
jgi:hypothetical protein